MLRPGEILIDDSTPFGGHELSGGMRGTVPRDWTAQPIRPYRAVEMPLIPRSEWPERIRDMERTESRLSDFRLRGNNGLPIPSLDQGPVGYCWAHGPAHCVTLIRAVMNLPYVPLSAYAVAATIKNGRDEGGWGALAQDFIVARGIPSQEMWAQGDRDYRKSRPGCWEDAATRKIQEGWMDVAAPAYDRNLSFDQQATSLLSRCPYAGDYDFWGHDVCAMDLLDLEPARDLMDPDRWGVRIWNSWGDAWGDRGMGTLKGQRANASNATAVRVVMGG